MTKRIVVILGPTASGKSDIAVKIARKFNGEIISADSRQIYKGLNIGSGKITKKKMMGIPHHLLDAASPKRKFTVSQYRKLTLKVIDKIFKKGKLPIICGGTGFYIQAVIDGISIPEVKPDWKLRKELERKTKEGLLARLKKLDFHRAQNIDPNNKRKLIRAIEIVMVTKKPVQRLHKNPLPYPILILGIKKDSDKLKKLIRTRLQKRLKSGMIGEVKNLIKKGVSFKRLEELGLEYKRIAQLLQNKINHQEMAEILQKDIEHYAKRQMTWFKKDKRTRWVKNPREAEALTKKFLS